VPLLIGVKLPHTGPVRPDRVADGARALEAAGFDSLWVSDHVVMPEHIGSLYPFAADGVATWPSDTPYLEAIVTLAAAAAVTSRVRLGTAVLVLPQRNPVLLAKQAATVDALSCGRLDLGVGAGWLHEEFDALHAPFQGRAARMQTWIEVLRDCWSGRPAARTDGYPLAAGTLVLPRPNRPIPILLGGHSSAALDRAGRLGDGWLGQQSVPDLDPTVLSSDIDQVRRAATTAGRDPLKLRFVLRLVESRGRHSKIAAAAAALEAAGVTEIIVDVDPFQDDPAAVRATLAGGSAS
jgi:probable F420-dependent oxidoreductase